MEPFVFFLLLVVGIAAAIAMARWIAQPLESLAKSRQALFQFTVSDLLTLVAMLQLAVGTVHYRVMRRLALDDPAQARDFAFSVNAFAATLIVLWWWCGASMVSRAGIRAWWHRAIILTLVVPCGFASSIATVVFVSTGLSSVAQKCDTIQTILTMTGFACAILAVAGACGLVTRWIAAKYHPREVAAEPDSEHVS